MLLQKPVVKILVTYVLILNNKMLRLKRCYWIVPCYIVIKLFTEFFISTLVASFLFFTILINLTRNTFLMVKYIFTTDSSYICLFLHEFTRFYYTEVYYIERRVDLAICLTAKTASHLFELDFSAGSTLCFCWQIILDFYPFFVLLY